MFLISDKPEEHDHVDLIIYASVVLLAAVIVVFWLACKVHKEKVCFCRLFYCSFEFSIFIYQFSQIIWRKKVVGGGLCKVLFFSLR